MPVFHVSAYNWRNMRRTYTMDQSWQETHEASDDEMARNKTPSCPRAVSAAIAEYGSRLKAAGRDRARFEQVARAIEKDRLLSVADVIAIALQYRGGGAKPNSKRAALEVLSKRFLEVVRDHTQGVQASKARPW
jgi:hypothetical protein